MNTKAIKEQTAMTTESAVLPQLTGTEKQIELATEIRSQVLVNVARALKISHKDLLEEDSEIFPAEFMSAWHDLRKAQAEKLMANTEAKFWIDSAVLAIGALLPDSHPMACDTPFMMHRDWDKAERATIKALRAKYSC